MEGKIKVKGKKIVRMNLNIKKDKIEIINESYEMIVMNGDKEE